MTNEERTALLFMELPPEIVAKLSVEEWLAVVCLLGASVPALPPEPPEGFVRVRARVHLDVDGGWQVTGGAHWTKRDWRGDDRRWPAIGYVTADVPLPKPAEVVGRVEPC